MVCKDNYAVGSNLSEFNYADIIVMLAKLE